MPDRKPKGHRVTYTPHAGGRLTADCGCGWTYTNSVRTDVRWQASCHRSNASRQQPQDGA